jgi:lysophospholipase L1-like esterase
LEGSPKPRVEVIRDSISAGYGAEGPHTIASDSTDLSYGAEIARKFDAGWSIVARSGISLSIGSGGDAPMPQRYPYIHFVWFGTSLAWDFTSYESEVAIVALATNDFVYGNPSEAQFATAYLDFLATIQGNYPNAKIFLLNPLVGSVSGHNNSGRLTAARQYIQNVANRSNDKVYFVEVGGPGDPVSDAIADYSGDRTHPNASGHSKIANRLNPIITSIIGAGKAPAGTPASAGTPVDVDCCLLSNWSSTTIYTGGETVQQADEV